MPPTFRCAIFGEPAVSRNSPPLNLAKRGRCVYVPASAGAQGGVHQILAVAPPWDRTAPAAKPPPPPPPASPRSPPALRPSPPPPRARSTRPCSGSRRLKRFRGPPEHRSPHRWPPPACPSVPQAATRAVRCVAASFHFCSHTPVLIPPAGGAAHQGRQEDQQLCHAAWYVAQQARGQVAPRAAPVWWWRWRCHATAPE